ncbi:MAG: hypothetical protein KC414_14925 [Romboutsia sp.]|nr:hypothetical protein [Romboutsia sp.]
MIGKIKINFTSIRGFTWCNQMQDDIIFLYELDSDRQNKMNECIGEILEMELNEASFIAPYLHEPVFKLVGIVNAEDTPNNIMELLTLYDNKECIIL